MQQFTIAWCYYHDTASQKTCSQEYLQKNLQFAKFCILQIFWKSRFSTHTKELSNFITTYHIMVSLQWHSFSESLQSGQPSRWSIHGSCSLENIAFSKFSEDLGFQSLHKHWMNLQQFIIPSYHYHDTASQKACSQGSWVRDIFRKTCNLRNFAFYKF